MKNSVLFLTGLSGSGKGYFAENFIPRDIFYKLVSMTTRAPRATEINGREYHFVTEQEFYDMPRATTLFVNQAFWQPGDAKWLYGVPEYEVLENLGKNLIYDVIEPKYIRQMIDWFCEKGFAKKYDFKIAYFLPPDNNFDIAQERAVMNNDLVVRKANTCNPIDFVRASVDPDWLVKSSATETILNPNMMKWLKNLARMTARG